MSGSNSRLVAAYRQASFLFCTRSSSCGLPRNVKSIFCQLENRRQTAKNEPILVLLVIRHPKKQACRWPINWKFCYTIQLLPLPIRKPLTILERWAPVYSFSIQQDAKTINSIHRFFTATFFLTCDQIFFYLLYNPRSSIVNCYRRCRCNIKKRLFYQIGTNKGRAFQIIYYSLQVISHILLHSS